VASRIVIRRGSEAAAIGGWDGLGFWASQTPGRLQSREQGLGRVPIPRAGNLPTKPTGKCS